MTCNSELQIQTPEPANAGRANAGRQAHNPERDGMTTVDMEVPDAGGDATSAQQPGEHITLALKRLRLAQHLVGLARDAARAAGLDGITYPAIGQRTRQARREVGRLADAIQRDAQRAGIELDGAA